MSVKRDWSAALEKKAAEGYRCRVCRRSASRQHGIRIEMAHIIGREADRLAPLAIDRPVFEIWPEPYLVVPTRVVPLCGPATNPATCHGKAHCGRLDWLPHLTLPEILQAVADASRLYGGNGFENARLRLVPIERVAA
jgi:hypothetical protein